jgi:hypothetical protein
MSIVKVIAFGYNCVLQVTGYKFQGAIQVLSFENKPL